MRRDSAHRVQFSEDTDTFGHDSDIAVHAVSDSLINVHLGFLQVRLSNFTLAPDSHVILSKRREDAHGEQEIKKKIKSNYAGSRDYD